MPPTEFKIDNYSLPDSMADKNPNFIFEYNEAYGGTLKGQPKPVADSLMAFDIKTSAKEA